MARLDSPFSRRKRDEYVALRPSVGRRGHRFSMPRLPLFLLFLTFGWTPPVKAKVKGKFCQTSPLSAA